MRLDVARETGDVVGVADGGRVELAVAVVARLGGEQQLVRKIDKIVRRKAVLRRGGDHEVRRGGERVEIECVAGDRLAHLDARRRSPVELLGVAQREILVEGAVDDGDDLAAVVGGWSVASRPPSLIRSRPWCCACNTACRGSHEAVAHRDGGHGGGLAVPCSAAFTLSQLAKSSGQFVALRLFLAEISTPAASARPAMPSRSPTTVSEAREDAYYARHKSTLEQGVGLAIDAAVVEGATESDARGNGPDPMLFVAKQILAQHGIDTEGVYSGTSKWNDVVAVGDHVYGAPYNADKLIAYTERPSPTEYAPLMQPWWRQLPLESWPKAKRRRSMIVLEQAVMAFFSGRK